MSKTLKMFLSAMVVVTLTTVIYYTIAALAGGLDKLIDNAFGGITSALSIIALLGMVGAFGRYTYWLSERRSSGKATSGLHAAVSTAVLIIAAIIGIGWVQWGWSLLWLIPLLVPTIGAAWAISAIAQNIYQAPAAETTPSSIDDLLTE